MLTNYRASRVFVVSVLSLFFAVAITLGQVPPQVADTGPQSPATAPSTPLASKPAAISPASNAPAAEGSEYVGAETCKTCHEKIYDNWAKTPHWQTTLDTKGGPSHQGCEGCHGAGAAHVAGGGDVSKIFTFKNASTKEINARCMTCHAGGPQHMNAINSCLLYTSRCV